MVGCFTPLRAWFDIVADFPGIIDFPLQPSDYFFGLFLVLQSIDGNLPGMDGDQFAGTLQGQCRRIFEVAETTEHRVQIGQDRADIVVEVGDTVQRSCSGIT